MSDKAKKIEDAARVESDLIENSGHYKGSFFAGYIKGSTYGYNLVQEKITELENENEKLRNFYNSHNANKSAEVKK
jgi:hypothetical protein